MAHGPLVVNLLWVRKFQNWNLNAQTSSLYAFSYKELHIAWMINDAFKIIDILLRLYMYVLRRYNFVYMFEFHILIQRS